MSTHVRSTIFWPECTDLLAMLQALNTHELAHSTLYLIETPFNSFANRVDLDQAALTSCLIRVFSVCLWVYDISDPTFVDMAINFFVLCTNICFV